GGSYPFDFHVLVLAFGAWWTAAFMPGLVLPVVALGATFLLRDRWRDLLPIYALLIYCTLVHAATHAEARLSDPLQPYLVLLVAGAAVRAAPRPLTGTARLGKLDGSHAEPLRHRQAVRRADRPRRRHVGRARRRARRAHGPERRRQVDAPPHHRGRSRARLRRALGRLADARRARAAAPPPPRHPAARRAHQLPRPRGAQLARGVPRRLRGHDHHGGARPLLPRRYGRPHRRGPARP